MLVPAERDPPAPPDAAAKLTDFGGASIAEEDALTRTGDVLGTLAYMAPEQSEGREAGEPADLYSLALVLYEALCGRQPGSRRDARPPPRGASGRASSRSGVAARDLPRRLTRGDRRRAGPGAARAAGTLHDLRVALQEALDGDRAGDTLGAARPRAGAARAARAAAPAARGRPPDARCRRSELDASRCAARPRSRPARRRPKRAGIARGAVRGALGWSRSLWLCATRPRRASPCCSPPRSRRSR